MSFKTKLGEGEKATEVTQHYLLFVPTEYGKDKAKKWPLLVFLHGAGERGDDLSLVKKHGPPKNVDTKPEFPFVVVSPQCPSGEHWGAERINAIIDHALATYAVEPKQVYLTGLSLGGFGTWSYLAQHPEKIAAAVPICGGGDPKTAEKFKDVPLWVFHGGKDTAVPIARSEEMIKALKESGANPKFTVYPDAGHDSWTQAYNTPELYTWLLEHKKL